MRIRQYAYFTLRSRYISAAEMTARLGVEPDEISVRGSRRAVPPRPLCHTWDIVCREPGRQIDEQLTPIVRRLRPHMRQLAALIDELSVGDAEYGGGALRVVRYFGDTWGAEGEEEKGSAPDAPLQKIPGQHQLLDWVLGREVLEFLLATNTSLHADEYG